MAKKKKTTSQKNYSAQDYLNMARDAEKKTQRETELRESRTATDYLNMARQAQGEQPIPKRKKEDDQEKGNAGEKLNRAALLMSRMPGAGDLKRQELNRTARALQQAAARSYKSDGKNWSLAGTGSVFDPIGTTTKRREFESGLDTELLQSNLNRLTAQEKREQSAQKDGNASSLHQRTQPKEWMMPVKREFGSRVGSGVETFGGGGGKIDAQKEPETAREALFGESLTDRKARVQNALYEAASAADRAQRSAFNRKGAQERLAEIAGLKQTDEQQREADYLDMAEGDDTAWLSPAEMQTLKEKNGTYGEKYAQEERALNRGLNRSERYVYEDAMNTDSSFDQLAEEGRAMDTRMKNAEDVLAYPHDAKAAAEAEKLVKYTTDAERKTYYYTLRTQGQQAADAYLDALDADLNRRRGEAQLEATRQTVNSGALGAIGANAYSVLSSVGETPAYISNLIQFLRGQEIDPYSPENMVSRVNEEIRGQTTQNIENAVPGFGGKALGFGYGVGMDLARSRYNMMLGLGMGGNSKIGKWTSSALMGTSAAQSALTDALDRGATDEQATATSIFSGIWETLFEEWSLENLLHLESPTSRRQWLTNVLLQSATEGSEELFTEMANTLTDELIMKDLSNYRLNKKAYEASGLTEEEARRNAMADVAKNWGMAALGGFASGAVGAGVHQGIEYHQNRRNERFQNAMKAYENNRQQQTAPQTVEEAASAAAQNDRLNNSEQNITKTQQMNEETNGAARQTAARDGSVPAAYEGGGTSENVEIDQQSPVSRVEKGTVYLRTADGSDVRASDVTFGDERDNLLAAEGVGRMSPAGITGMLNHYDGTKATAKEYASAYLSVYNRARAGMTVQQAVYDSAQTRSALTEEAAMAAYAAGEKMNMGRIVPMTRAEKQRQQAQLDLVSAINEKFSKSGVKIEMVDRIEGYGGQEANGRWDSETNTIYVSKNADDHAYAYIAMHELTHAMKSRNDSEFQEFGDWVVYYLNESGQDADALVRGEMIAQAQAMGLMERQKADLTTEEQLKLLDGLSEEQYRQLNELAQEELICNTVPSVLQNENVLMDLYHTKPTLFERIKDFLKEFIDAVRGTGKELGKTRAFQQMEAMGKNQAALEDIYNRMVQMAENAKEGSVTGKKVQEKFSLKEDVEETKDMIAVHNISLDNLKSMIDIGGLPSPSIAAVVSEKGHTEFGPISLMFGKETIDPKADKRNKLYGNDAWTPMVKGVETSMNFQKWDQVVGKLKNEIDMGTKAMLRKYIKNVDLAESVYERGLDARKTGSTTADAAMLIDQLSNAVDTKLAYLEETGLPEDLFPSREDFEGDKEWAQEFERRLNEAASEDKVKDWVKEKTEGIFGDKVLADRKTGEVEAFTAENVMKQLHKMDDYGNGWALDNVWQNAAKKYKSIDQMKADSGRLRASEAEVEQKTLQLNETIRNVNTHLAEDMKGRENAKIHSENGRNTAQAVIMEAAKLRHTPLRVKSYLLSHGVRLSNRTFNEVMTMFRQAAEIPADFFESKPDRVVGFGEVKAMVVPNSMQEEVQNLLNRSGITAEVVGYEDGSDRSRIDVMNSEELSKYKFSMKEEGEKETEHYDYSTPFIQQVDDLLEGKIPERDALVIGKTPDVLKNIGFSNLPMTINTEHIKNMNRDTEHVLSRAFMEQLPELIKDPLAVIESKTSPESSTVMLLNAVVNGKPYVAPVYVTSNSRQNGVVIDSNNIATVFRKGNAITKLLTDAIQKENAGETGVYYWKKNEAQNLYARAGVQFPGSAVQDGLIHSILKKDSPVNRKFVEQTETRQFQRWFGKSKVVDEDGKPLVVYHGTDAEFNVFDMSKGRANMDIQGAFFSPYELDAQGYGENVKAYYLSIQNPADEGTAYKALNRFKGQNNAGIKAREYLQKQGYDGVYNGYDEYIAFEPTQIKSAKNNVGTFDPFNPDVRYSLKETDEDVRKQVDLTRELMEETGGYRLTQADAERVMKRVAKEFGSQTDASELAADFARVMEYARQQNADMDQVDNELLSIADKMIANSQQLDEEHEEEVKPIREKLRKTAISLTDSQKAEAASLTGSLGAYRKALFGQVRLSQQSGVSLDSVWSELSDLSPTLFPADTAEGDMPRLLMEAADAVKPIIENQYGLDSEEAAQYAVMQMVDQYMKLPGVQKTARDQKRMGLTADQYRELMDAFLQKSEKQFQSAWVKTWMQKEKAIGAQKEQEARTRYQEWKQQRAQQTREWKQAQSKAMQEKYRQWRQTDTETRRNREAVNTYRDRLERTTRTLLNWMEKPNKTQHVPMELQSDVQKVLAGLDFSGKTTLAAKDLGSRIEAMTQRIGELQEKTDENGASSQTFYLERDQQMLDELHHLAAVIGANNGNVYELSAAELRDLNKWMNAVKHVITDVNKNHAKYYQGKYYQGESQYGTIEEVADSTKAELHRKKAYADKKGVTRAWNEMLGKGMVDCFSFFDKMGSAGGEVFGNLRKGFDKHIRNVSAAKSYTESLLEGVDQKTLREWTNEKKRTEYTTDRGETIRLNTAEVMELYVLSQREQAQSHLYGQGIRTNEKVEPVMLTRGDVERITGTLTKEQKQIADRMQRFLARDCAAWGNEASRVLVGYDKFGEEHYWPIRTDPNSNRTLNADGSAANLSYIKNQSFTKELTEKAQNAIMVESIFGTYTRHISQMSAYNAYAVAMTDLQRWFNTPGVKTEIERAYGRNGVLYITDLMKQINGTADNGKTFGGAKDAVNKLVSHGKAAAVGANLSVAIQQPTAYVRAADMISPKYLQKGLFQKSDIGLVKKWCPIAMWKSWGFYETDVGRGLNDLIVDQSNALERATEKSMILAEKGDEWTWGKLWNAVAAETRDLYAGELEPGTDAFYEKVGQRLSEIIDKTQVVDSVFHRSPIMRDRGFSAIYTSFMAEPIKTYNMVERAIANFAENRKDPAAKRRLMRTMAVYVVNALAGAMAKSIPAAARDDDKEKQYWEKYLEALGENTMDNLLFTNNIPVISDYLDTLRGNEPSRMDIQSIDRLRQFAQEVPKIMTGESKWSTFKGLYKFAQIASDITGVPAYAAIRDAKAIVQTVGSAIGQDWYIPMENETASFSYAAENLYEAIRKGDSKAETRLREKLGATKSPAQIDAAVAGVLMQQDSRVAEAAALKLQGKATELNQKKQEMVADGFTAEMVDKAVNRYITEGQAEKEKDLTKELKANLWSKEEAVTALRTAAGLTEGSATADDVKAIVSELVADSTAKDPAKTVKSGIVSEVKKDYVSLMEEGKTTEAKGLLRVLQDTLGVTDADAKGWVTEGHQESLRTAAEAMDVRALKAAMTKLKKDGKTDQSMKSSIEGVLKKQYLAAKEAGDRGQMEKIIRFLTGLDLKNAKGEKYFTREKIQAWGE